MWVTFNVEERIMEQTKGVRTALYIILKKPVFFLDNMYLSDIVYSRL